MGKTKSTDRRNPLTLKQAAAKLNDYIERTIEAFGLKPFMLRTDDAEKFAVHTMDVGGPREYQYLYKPYGINLTPIGYWTDTCSIMFEDSRTSSIDGGEFSARVHWSSGNDSAAGADLIKRASEAVNALNLAFHEFHRKNRIVKDGEKVVEA